MQKALNKKERNEIFRLFLENNKLKFNEIEKVLKIRSNMVSYHLTSMVKDGLLTKKGEYYVLTKNSEKYIPLFSDMSDSDVGPLPVILVAVMHKNKILLVKRNKRPYKDYWSMIGGKLLLHEDVKSASIRKVVQKTALDVEFISLNNILHEHVEGEGIIKHSFILLFTKVNSKSLKFSESKAGALKWFDLKKLNKIQIIPSDYWLIKNSLNKKINVPRMYMCERDGVIESHKIIK